MNRDRYIEIVEECEMLVFGVFQDEEKTKLWFKTPNPNLGGIAPNLLINSGRAEKLLQVIKAMSEGY